LALILGKNVTFEQIKNVALTAENKILKSVGLFDIYTGDKIPEGKKQYALSFVLLDTQKTLTDKVIEKTMAKIQSAIEQQLKATLR
jgi:phenylalanyl-tRNA synthetase beta chain